MRSETLMIVGAAEEHCLGIRRAHELGLSVFVTDGNPESRDFREADRYAMASTYDVNATLAAGRE